MTKYFIIIAVLAVLAMVVLVGCSTAKAVLSSSRTYEIKSDVHSLNVEIGAAEFTIIEDDEFRVESNLKYLTVEEKGGVLTIVENTKINVGLGYNNAELKLYIPKNILFENADITTGAAKFNADTLSAKTLVLKTGAGKTEFDLLKVSESVKIKGGAGEISINDGTLNNLNLNLGVGKLNMTAELKGCSNLKFGVGQSDLTLIGDKSDYQLNITTGVGKVTVDGANSAAFANSGNGENTVNIKGGVGSTDISFK